jgi:uncharacterized protein (DUF1501 family)
VPSLDPEEDLVTAMNFLLHELRSPVSVAQGYMRLLLEDRLSSTEQKRAITQSLEALAQVNRLCGDASEFTNTSAPDSTLYPASALTEAIKVEAQALGLSLDIRGAAAGNLRTREPARAAAAIGVIVQAALSADAPRDTHVCVDITGAHLVVTSVDEIRRARLLSPSSRRAPFDAWRGHRSFLVPLAAKQLRRTGARLWTLEDDPTAVAIDIQLETQP